MIIGNSNIILDVFTYGGEDTCFPDWELQLGNSLQIEALTHGDWKVQSGNALLINVSCEHLETCGNDWTNPTGNVVNVDFDCCDITSECLTGDWTNPAGNVVDVDFICCGSVIQTEPTIINGNSSISVDVVVNSTGSLLISGDSSISVDVVTTGSIVYTIIGNSSISVDVATSGVAGWVIEGNSSISVDVTTSGYIAHDILGNSSISVDVATTGTGVREIDGNSNITVDVTTVGEFIYTTGINGNSSITVDVATTGTAEASPVLFSSITVSVSTSGNGGWTGGPEMFASSAVGVSVATTGTAQFVYPISGLSQQTISILSTGTGSTLAEIIEGDSNQSIDVETTGTSYLDSINKEYLIKPFVLPTGPVRFTAKMVVDVDNKKYEIRDIKTNRTYLEKFNYDKWTNKLEIGSVIKDYIETNYEEENISSNRNITLRKYGCSELVIDIVIDYNYQFIKNQINIIKTITREFDRALLDTYSLYELEFE